MNKTLILFFIIFSTFSFEFPRDLNPENLNALKDLGFDIKIEKTENNELSDRAKYSMYLDVKMLKPQIAKSLGVRKANLKEVQLVNLIKVLEDISQDLYSLPTYDQNTGLVIDLKKMLLNNINFFKETKKLSQSDSIYLLSSEGHENIFEVPLHWENILNNNGLSFYEYIDYNGVPVNKRNNPLNGKLKCLAILPENKYEWLNKIQNGHTGDRPTGLALTLSEGTNNILSGLQNASNFALFDQANPEKINKSIRKNKPLSINPNAFYLEYKAPGFDNLYSETQIFHPENLSFEKEVTDGKARFRLFNAKKVVPEIKRKVIGASFAKVRVMNNFELDTDGNILKQITYGKTGPNHKTNNGTIPSLKDDFKKLQEDSQKARTDVLNAQRALIQAQEDDRIKKLKDE